MGAKKQNSISNFFIEIPSTNRSLPETAQPAPLPEATSIDTPLPSVPLSDHLEPHPPAAEASNPAMAEVLPPPAQVDKVLHPFFNKESRHAIQKAKSSHKPEKEDAILHKILPNDESSKVTKPKKRGRARKVPKGEAEARFSLPGHVSYDELFLGALGNEGHYSDGDFPTPSSTHSSSDYNDSDVDEQPKKRPTKKRRKDVNRPISLPTPPRSSENETSAATKITLTGPPIRSTPPPPTLPTDYLPVSHAVESATQPIINGVTTAPTATRSAFDLMKKSSTSMVKTRSRSRSPSPPGTEGPPSKKARTRGRPRKSVAGEAGITVASLEEQINAQAAKKSLVVKLKIGQKAAARLAAPPEPPKSLIVTLKLSKEKLEKATPKPHPFFMKTSEKRKQVDETAGKPATETKWPVFKSNPFPFQRDSKPKFKVEHHPAWPSRENIHVRNIGEGEGLAKSSTAHTLSNISSQKGKSKQSEVLPSESVLEKVSNQYTSLHAKYCYQDHSNGPPVSHPTVRIPGRRLLGASEIVTFLQQQIEPSRLFSERAHPAIRELMTKIGNGDNLLTAFDRSDCETQLWSTIYAPTSSGSVLQTGQEAKELSNWLACMKITSVDTGNSKPKAPIVKKKKKPKTDLDDFIVTEDEDQDSMSDLTDPEDVDFLLPGPHSSKAFRKSEIRRKGRSAVASVAANASMKARISPPPVKLPNAILLSGPSGVGKTAAVYAAAKEHDFVVFEINAGTKRGGKEIQEMVGDMSRNHLVHQTRPSEQLMGTATEQVASTSSTGGFNNFFSKKGSTQAAGGTETKEKEKVKQQQSLILIEEADILYEEDSGFWRSIVTLIEKSRRPVVITCNNEKSISSEIDFYAILRFKPAAPDLAADYLLTMAAAQGHFLDRAMIRNIYEGNGYDLRKSIAHLSFWCQMAIGDHTWCSRWFYLRDDPDKVNVRTAAGEVKRSISEGSYLPEMDSFGRQLVIGEDGRPLSSNEIDEVFVWKDLMDGAGVDVQDRLFDTELQGWMRTTKNADDFDGASTARDKALLSSYADYIDTLSALDSFGRFGAFSNNDTEFLLDPTPNRPVYDDEEDEGKSKIPPAVDKDAPDDLLGIRIFDAERRKDPHSTSSLLSITGHILARNVLDYSTKSFMGEDSLEILSPKLTESNIIKLISSNSEFVRGREKKDARDLRWPFDRVRHGGHSQIDRSTPVMVDTIPYVREIARYDRANGEVAREMSSLISQRPGGKKRTTRASAYASEGRSRGGVRPRGEQYFRGSLDAMIATGGSSWGEAVYLYTPQPEPEPEPEMDEVGEKMVVENMMPVDDVQEELQPMPVVPEDGTRPSRRMVIHDDIEEWSSDA